MYKIEILKDVDFQKEWNITPPDEWMVVVSFDGIQLIEYTYWPTHQEAMESAEMYREEYSDEELT